MSRIVELQRELQDAAMAVAHAERTLAAHPDMPSVLATLQTIQKRRENLQKEFTAAANELGLDVCSYRIEMPDGAPATIAAMTAILGAFQKTFTSVYDALLNGPKKTTKTSPDVLGATSFEFAYTFPGSVGVMMTLPVERMLLDGTQLEKAIATTFELMTANNPQKIEEMTERLGVAAVRQAHHWASENAKAHFGADIAWQRDHQVLREIRMQPQELRDFAITVGLLSAKEEVVLTGELTEVSLENRTFKMKADGKMFSGTFDAAISASKPAQLPKIYKATLTVRQKVVPSNEQEEITYFLLRLDAPDSPTGLLVDRSS